MSTAHERIIRCSLHFHYDQWRENENWAKYSLSSDYLLKRISSKAGLNCSVAQRMSLLVPIYQVGRSNSKSTSSVSSNTCLSAAFDVDAILVEKRTSLAYLCVRVYLCMCTFYALYVYCLKTVYLIKANVLVSLESLLFQELKCATQMLATTL